MRKYTLKLRSLGRGRNDAHPIEESGRSYLDKVEGLPEGEEAWITDTEKKGSWQISRKKNGVRGNWAGDYKSAQAALAALQKMVDSENPMTTGRRSA